MTLIGCALLFSFGINGQNLVPNPSFEVHTNCPGDYGQIELATPWIRANDSETSLLSVCENGNEDFNSIPSAGPFSTIYNYHQYARTGDSEALIVNYRNLEVANSYLQVQLREVLQKDSIYNVEFYVMPVVGMNKGIDKWAFADAIGLSFLEKAYYDSTPLLDETNTVTEASAVFQDIEPVIENKGKIIRDTTEWTRICGFYRATGTESFIIIGNFYHPDEVITEFSEPLVFNQYSWLYVDDVLVEKYVPMPDTILLCDLNELVLEAPYFDDANYNWINGGTGAKHEIRTSGTYVVEIDLGSCTIIDSTIVIKDDSVLFQQDTTICKQIPLKIESPFYGNYSWSTGEDKKQIVVNESGLYELEVTNNCGTFLYEVEIEAEDCSCDFFMPNVFTPNGDGINDWLVVNFSCDYDYEVKSFIIYDRWGSEVFSGTSTFPSAWDGKCQKTACSSGVYVYVLHYSFLVEGEAIDTFATGDITVLE